MTASLRTRSLCRARLGLSIAVALGLQVAPAYAQTTDTQTSSTQDAQAKDKPKAAELDTIVVTANLRPEDRMKVAAPISVIDEDQLSNIGASQLTDFASYVPGLQAASDGTPGQTRISLRGIAPLSAGATVGTYIDQTPVGSSGLYQSATGFMLDLLPYDISRVEVLRGPQGTLYGAGSMGGLIKYITNAPDPTLTEFRAGAGFNQVSGGGQGYALRLGANLPVVQDHAALRVSLARNQLAPFINNPISGAKRVNKAEQTSGRVAFRWESDNVTVDASAMRQEIDSRQNAAVSLKPKSDQPMDGRLDHRFWVNEPFQKTADHYALEIAWNVGWGDFISSTGYSNIDTFRRQDTTIDYGQFANLALGLPQAGSSYFDNALDFKQLTQEFRLASKAGGRFDWLVGAFYSKERGNNRQHIALNMLDGSSLPSPYDGIAGDLATLQLPSTYQEWAVFGNANLKVTERFKIGLGLRYASNRQRFTQSVESGLLLPLGTYVNASKENVVTWSLTPQFNLTENHLLYARVATGYQPGGPNAALPGVPPVVNSSTLINYELGLKSAFANNRIQLDIAAFRIDWKDIQVSALFNGNSGLVNGGQAQSRGLEVSLQFRPTTDLRFGVNAAYTHATLKDDFPIMQLAVSPTNVLEINSGLAGDRMPYTPKWAFSATGDYEHAMGQTWRLYLGGGYRWTAERLNGTTERQVLFDTSTTPRTTVMTQTNAPIKLRSYGSLDLYAGVTNDRWNIRAYVKNATNTRAFSSVADHIDKVAQTSVEYLATPIQPRTVGLEFDVVF